MIYEFDICLIRIDQYSYSNASIKYRSQQDKGILHLNGYQCRIHSIYQRVEAYLTTSHRQYLASCECSLRGIPSPLQEQILTFLDDQSLLHIIETSKVGIQDRKRTQGSHEQFIEIAL